MSGGLPFFCRVRDAPRLRRRGLRTITIAVLAALALVAIALPRPATAQAVKGELSAVVENGYARLVFHLGEEVESQVRVANGILTVSFARPVEVSVDRLNGTLRDYVSAARRDPDGKAVRIALIRKVTLNVMPASERLFVDLLPETWTGLLPGLPRDVIEELARRTRDAEKRLKAEQRNAPRPKQIAPIRVRVVTQPTFVRYVFDLPELIGVSADNGKDRLTLTFDSALKFDLADAKATLPPTVQSIDGETDPMAAVVRFSFAAKVDVRTFREDNSYVVDVTSPDERAGPRDGSVRSDQIGDLAPEANNSKKPPAVDAPQTVPAPGPSGKPPERTPQASPREAQIPPPQPPPVKPPAAPRSNQTPSATPAVPPRREGGATQPAAEPDPVRPGDDGAINIAVRRQGDALTLAFPFSEPTAAAVFQRADTLWLVFDTDAALALKQVDGEPMLRGAMLTKLPGLAMVRLKLERPRLISVAAVGAGWAITLGNEKAEAGRPLAVTRNVGAPGRSNVSVAMEDPRRLHRIVDPDAGDTLMVVTGLGPVRGLLKTQDFVEFRALASSHGVVVQPLADDLNAELTTDKVVLMRPAGLTLSPAMSNTAGGPSYSRQVLDSQAWGYDRQANFPERRSQLVEAAAAAPESRKFSARADLARFYLSRDLAAEAKGVLDVALAGSPPGADDSAQVVLHAIACILSGRPELALKDLANPAIGNQHEAPLWRSLAFARLSKWADAREGFRNVEAADRHATDRDAARDAQGDDPGPHRDRRHHRRHRARCANSMRSAFRASWSRRFRCCRAGFRRRLAVPRTRCGLIRQPRIPGTARRGARAAARDRRCDAASATSTGTTPSASWKR